MTEQYSRAHSPMSHGAMTERINREREPHMADRVESRIHLAAKQEVARVPRSLLEHCQQVRAAAAEQELRASDLESTIGSTRYQQVLAAAAEQEFRASDDLGSTIGSARSEQCILESLQPRQDVAQDVLVM